MFADLRLFTAEDSGIGYLKEMGFAGEGFGDALKCKDAESVLIQKIEVKRRGVLFGAGAWVSGSPELQLSLSRC